VTAQPDERHRWFTLHYELAEPGRKFDEHDCNDLSMNWQARDDLALFKS